MVREVRGNYAMRCAFASSYSSQIEERSLQRSSIKNLNSIIC